MSRMVEVDEHGAIQLPADVLAAVKPHTRFRLEIHGEKLVLSPVTALPFWQTATHQEQAEAVRQWAALKRPSAPVLPDEALHRDAMYEE